jgi:hypothetical protein
VLKVPHVVGHDIRCLRRSVEPTRRIRPHHEPESEQKQQRERENEVCADREEPGTDGGSSQQKPEHYNVTRARQDGEQRSELVLARHPAPQCIV